MGGLAGADISLARAGGTSLGSSVWSGLVRDCLSLKGGAPTCCLVSALKQKRYQLTARAGWASETSVALSELLASAVVIVLTPFQLV